MLLLLALLSAPEASAHTPRPEIQIQGGAFRTDHGPRLAGSVRAFGQRDAYVGVEGRLDPHQQWVGRVGAGFDVLGGGKWDLRLGLFIGGAGTAFRQESEFIAGTELATAARVGRLYGQWRWLLGLGHSAQAALHSENEFTLGFHVVDEVRLQGQAILSHASNIGPGAALGLGVAVVF